jgi:selenocysteine lyase/cysteine desulfurase
VTPAPDVDIVQQLLAACDERTRLVAVSWVSYSSGRRIDLDRLGRALRAQGVLLFVDAIQGLGVFPLDVSRTAVDFFAADGHKWMLGPEGAGLFYVRRELIDQLRPIGVGWHSVPHAFDYSRVEFALRADARRFEGGSHNMLGLCGLAASLGLLRRFGLGPQDHRLADRVLDVAAHVRSRVAEVGGEIAGPVDLSEQSGIVSFTLPGCDSVALRRRCLEAGVVVSCRDGRLRVAAHAYNNDDDIDRLIDVLRSS